jgi:hypothetical protein
VELVPTFLAQLLVLPILAMAVKAMVVLVLGQTVMVALELLFLDTQTLEL